MSNNKQSMKLYTEEQVREIIERAELNKHLTYGDVLDGIFPIELPEVTMSNLLKYNLQIFKTWFVYILLRKKLSNQAIELMNDNYNFRPREKKLFQRIKKIQGGNK